MGNRPIRGGLSFPPHTGLLTWQLGNLEVIYESGKRQTKLSKIIKSAIHVARLTIHVICVRNSPIFSDKLVEDWRWWTR